MDEPLIVRVVHRYNPGWEPPADNGRTWVRCLCAFHAEDTPSAAVSYELDAYSCLACGVKGNAVTLIKQQEGVSHRTAVELAAGVSAGSNQPVPRQPRRVRRRAVFGEPGPDSPEHRGGRLEAPPWVR